MAIAPLLLTTLAAIALPANPSPATPVGSGQVDIVLTDQKTGKPVGARMIVRDQRGRVRRFPNSVYQGDYTYVFYEANIKLPEGTYTFEIDAGPEYRIFTGNFEVLSGAEAKQDIKMDRRVNLPEEGWWATDLSVTGPLEELEVMLDASGIDVAGWHPPSKRKVRRRNPEFHAPTRPRSSTVATNPIQGPTGSRGLVLSSSAPEDDGKSLSDLDARLSLSELVSAARADAETYLLADSCLANELPLWIGLDLVDGVGVLPWFLGEDAEPVPANGYTLDRKKRRNAYEIGRLNVEAWFELLECGYRLPAVGWSTWSDFERPIGTIRTMIAADETGDQKTSGLAVGKTWVTNGPLMRVRANGELPGSVFEGSPGQPVSLNLSLRVSTRYPVKNVEVIQNGQVIYEVALKDLAKAGGKIPRIEFQESGWLVMRIVSSDQRTYRAAISSPFYVEIGDRPRISKTAVQQQIDRLEELSESSKFSDADRELIKESQVAWETRLHEANAE